MLVRVCNDNKFDHVEKFRGETLKIPAGGFVEMEREDAVLFRGQFYPPKFDKGGLQTMESKKIIRIEKIPEKPSKPEIEEDKDLICQACGFKAKTAAGLKSHIRSNHAHLMQDDDARQNIMEG